MRWVWAIISEQDGRISTWALGELSYPVAGLHYLAGLGAEAQDLAAGGGCEALSIWCPARLKWRFRNFSRGLHSVGAMLGVRVRFMIPIVVKPARGHGCWLPG